MNPERMNLTSDAKKTLLICLLLGAATISVYYQVYSFSFVNYDDAEYVQQNPYIKNGLTLQTVKWAFTTGYACFWHPATWLSHALDRQLFGLNPAGHHITAVIIHVANTLLMFLVFKKLTKAVWPSAFVAALFALHPLHVESVAWVSERKDVLSAFFWLLTMWTYASYAEKRGIGAYLLVLVFFVLGMMSKPMLVTLPFALLLLDYWPLDRIRYTRTSIRNLILEKVPLFAIAFAASIVAYIAQKQGKAIPAGEGFALPLRLANACISYIQYIIKMVWPARLSMFYPHPGKNVSFVFAAICLAILTAVTVFVILFSKNRRYLFTGWFWYIGTLVPVSGFIQVGNHAMADRYTYIPLTGLFIVIAWGSLDIVKKPRLRGAVLWPAAIAVLSALAVAAYFQCRLWKDTITLCEHALKVTENNYRAHFCITQPLLQAGRFDEAIEHANAAIRINPKCYEAYNNLGIGLVRTGRFDEAVGVYERLLQMRPDYSITRGNLAAIYVTQNRFEEAIEQCRTALETLEVTSTRRFLAYSLLKLGRFSEAIDEYMKVLAAEPDNPEALNKLSHALGRVGRFDEAIEFAGKALDVAPDAAEGHLNRGFALIGKDMYAEAVKEYEKALETEPQNALAHSEAGVAFFKLGKTDQAVAHFQEALKIDPNNQAAKTNLDFVLDWKEKSGQKETAGDAGESIDNATN